MAYSYAPLSHPRRSDRENSVFDFPNDQGPVCFIANNNSGQGSISGTGLSTTTQNTQQGILIGVASNPVPAGATFDLLFVAGDKNGNFVEGTASGTIGNGSMTGTGSCSSNTPICQGVSGTFSGAHQ
jgi:hypothetical protein